MGTAASRRRRQRAADLDDIGDSLVAAPDNVHGDGAVDEDALTPTTAHWTAEQLKLRKRLIVPKLNAALRFATIAGVDVSYPTAPSNKVAVSIAVFNVKTGTLLKTETAIVTAPGVPYIPGFLGFREVPLLAPLVRRYKPDVVMVDGNGRLHPRGFGSACHLEVECGVATIGVAKKLHTFGDLPTEKEVRALVAATGNDLNLVVDSQVVGRAIVPKEGVVRPLYVSPGHNMTVGVAVQLVRRFCRHRVPEPIREADHSSRNALRKFGLL